MSRVGLPLALLLRAPVASAQVVLPSDFQETVVLQGLTQPTAVKFSPDGRVFVAEKSGIVKVYTDLSDPVPDVFADLRTNVHNFWDRGLLGLALHPDFPTMPYVYVLYTLDKSPGAPDSTIPRWGTVGATSDGCPSPPGPTASGCPVTGRLSRLRAEGNVMTGPEEPLITDWCQQFPGHSVGDLVFGGDGALYVSAGEGANFNTTDYGQFGGTGGVPVNPCGDPPTAPGTTPSAGTAEGGALRSQSARRPSGHPVTLSGAILRIDPETGEGLADNPLYGSADANARRILAYGLRNPFRVAVRPGTNEVWAGDVGWSTWEEIDRIPDPSAAALNFGWPCYEGNGRQSAYDNLNIGLCESLYAAGSSASPYFTYNHNAEVVAGDVCPPNPSGAVSSAVAGLAFYDGGNYPAEYWGALFFADYNRNCIWAMMPGPNGVPVAGARRQFVGRASNPVHLETGPGGDLFYVDYDGGGIRRIRYFGQNQPPVAVLNAVPTNGPAPLTVQFDGSASHDADPGDRLTFAWDLDGDGQLDDASVPAPTWTYTAPGNHVVQLRVTDLQGASSTASVTISADNTPPTATITAPLPTATWRVGTVVTFAGSASDAQQGALPAAALTWTLVLHHCPSFDCHQHVVQSWPGIAGGSFTAPDHDYPSFLELQLLATDAGGLTSNTSVTLQPQTVDLTLESSPLGLTLGLNAEALPAPFTRRVIVGSLNTVSAPSPQVSAGVGVTFSAWSDGEAANHGVVAPAVNTTYRATFVNNPPPAGGAQFFTVTSRPGENRLEWVNPLVGPYFGTVIRYNASTPGTSDCVDPATETDGIGFPLQGFPLPGPGARDSLVHGPGLLANTKYCYTAFVQQDPEGTAFSDGYPNSGRPLVPGPVKWAMSTGAFSMIPPGNGLAVVHAVGQDGSLHSMVKGDVAEGGTWPAPPSFPFAWMPQRMNGPSQGRPSGIPVVTPGATRTIFLSSQDGRVYAFNAETGALSWISDPLAPPAALQAHPSGVFTVFGGTRDLVFVGTRDAGGSKLHALRLSDGKALLPGWVFDGGALGKIGAISGQAAVDQVGKRVYFASRKLAAVAPDDKTVWCVDLETGAGLWAAPHGDIDSGTSFAAGNLFLGANDGTVKKVDTVTPNEGVQAWSFTIPGGEGPAKGYVAVDRLSGSVFFSTATKVWALNSDATPKWLPGGDRPLGGASTPVVAPQDAFLYVGGGDGRLHRFFVSTGAEDVSPPFPILLGDGRGAAGSPTYDLAAGYLYVGTENGVVYAIQVP